MVRMCLWVLARSLSPTLGSASPIAFPNAWYASGVSGAHGLSCDSTDPSGTDEFAPTATFTDKFANVWNIPRDLPSRQLYRTRWQTENLLLATVTATIVAMLVAVYAFQLISQSRPVFNLSNLNLKFGDISSLVVSHASFGATNVSNGVYRHPQLVDIVGGGRGRFVVIYIKHQIQVGPILKATGVYRRTGQAARQLAQVTSSGFLRIEKI